MGSIWAGNMMLALPSPFLDASMNIQTLQGKKPGKGAQVKQQCKVGLSTCYYFARATNWLACTGILVMCKRRGHWIHICMDPVTQTPAFGVWDSCSYFSSQKARKAATKRVQCSLLAYLWVGMLGCSFSAQFPTHIQLLWICTGEEWTSSLANSSFQHLINTKHDILTY